jgi:hypothetical protein
MIVKLKHFSAATALACGCLWISSFIFEQPSTTNDLAIAVGWEEPEQKFGIGHEMVEIRVFNRSRAKIRILGAAKLCTDSCCVSPVVTSPIDVPAQASLSLPCVVETRRTGVLQMPVLLYADQNGVVKVEWNLVGTVISVKGCGNALPSSAR